MPGKTCQYPFPKPSRRTASAAPGRDFTTEAPAWRQAKAAVCGDMCPDSGIGRRCRAPTGTEVEQQPSHSAIAECGGRAGTSRVGHTIHPPLTTHRQYLFTANLWPIMRNEGRRSNQNNRCLPSVNQSPIRTPDTRRPNDGIPGRSPDTRRPYGLPVLFGRFDEPTWSLQPHTACEMPPHAFAHCQCNSSQSCLGTRTGARSCHRYSATRFPCPSPLPTLSASAVAAVA
jgi:hypothetical protein